MPSKNPGVAKKPARVRFSWWTRRPPYPKDLPPEIVELLRIIDLKIQNWLDRTP